MQAGYNKYKKMKKIFILIIFLIFSSWVYADAEAVKFKSSVDKKVLDINDTLTLTIQISSDEKSTPKLKMPDLKEFDILVTSSSNRLNLGGDKAISTTEIVYVMQPKISGELTIGPAEAKAGFKTYKTEVIKITVTGRQKPLPEKPPLEDKDFEGESVTL